MMEDATGIQTCMLARSLSLSLFHSLSLSFSPSDSLPPHPLSLSLSISLSAAQSVLNSFRNLFQFVLASSHMQAAIDYTPITPHADSYRAPETKPPY